ncbi:hypothetical protein N7468_002992 [Penicillium chermesinum]|uniref:Uncharacterized protein n=1 Tax=Penicillium chermesinum TaxID=63820 RepID=A0A9W9TRT7_9EURO|nr:uncharacterized protein N7468_002992 [Penicillium chermesinum]KAJ5238373.1 hypothetical protein N7468_002992 [Penicillium chermesinum]
MYGINSDVLGRPRLFKRSQWTRWLLLLKQRTVTYEVWEYLDPKTPDESAKSFLIPDPGLYRSKPSLYRILLKIKNAPQDSECSKRDPMEEYTLATEEYAIEETDYLLWEERKARWIRQQEGLWIALMFIHSTLLPKQHQFITNQGDIRQMIKDLEDAFSPENDLSHFFRPPFR